MLRKRTRSHQKDQQMGHSTSDSSESLSNSDVFLKQKHKTNSFFAVSGLFVGLSPKVSDCDSVRSPTSPLEFKVFSKSNPVNPFRFPKPSNEGTQKSWDCQKVGLSIIDSLDNETKESGKVLRSSDSKNILFGAQMRMKIPDLITRLNSFEAPNSLPKNYAIFPTAQIKPFNPQTSNSNALFGTADAPSGKFCSYSLDSVSSGSHLTALTNRRTKSSSENFCLENGSNPVSSPLGNSGGLKLNPVSVSKDSEIDFLGSLSASEIELSEDYTCVRTHGPNPKTTHIYGDCILECHNNELFIGSSKNQVPEAPLPSVVECSPEVPPSYPSDDFLSFCYSCKKKLEGEDIYMYRGEKAFCSWSCRSEEILIEEKMEKENNGSSWTAMRSNSCEELSETAMFIAA